MASGSQQQSTNSGSSGSANVSSMQSDEQSENSAPLWKYVTKLDKKGLVGGTWRFQCNFGKEIRSSSYSRQNPPFLHTNRLYSPLFFHIKGFLVCLRMGWKAAQKLIRNWKILRGDNVMIIRGKDKGETGTIKRVIRSQNRVIVEGKNLVKKHIKQGQGHEGGIFTVEAPLHVSNVQVVDPVTGKPCKVGVRYTEDGGKVRVARGIGASGSIIPRPEILKIRTTPRATAAGPKDTPMDFVLEKTYDPKTGEGMPNL